MNAKNCSVIEDLFELSEAADNLIEKTLSESAFDGSFFEDTRKEIYKIFITKNPAKRKKSERKSFFFRPKRESCLFEPFLEIRAHVHKKPCSKSSEESTITTNSSEESIACNKTEVSNISYFDKYEVKIKDSKGTSSGDSWKESPHQLKLDSESNSETTFEKYSTPFDSNVCKSTYSKIPEEDDSGNFHEISPISSEFKIKPIENEETIIISSSESDNITPQNVTIEKTDIQCVRKRISPGKLDHEKKATSERCVNKVDAKVSDLSKTYTLSSDSSEESICNNSLSLSSELCYNCSKLFSAKKQCKKKESKSLLHDYGVSPKNSSPVSSSGYMSGNPFEDNTSEKSPMNLRTKKSEKPLVNEKKTSITDMKPLLIQYQNKAAYRGNTSTENNSLSNKAIKESPRCSKKANNINPKKLLLTTISENVTTTFENQSSCFGEKKSSVASQPLGSLSSDSERSRVQGSKSKVIVKIPIEHYKRRFKSKPTTNKEHSAHLRIITASVNRKVTAVRNLRPRTPTDFMNSTHESLKVKAEEKRKQREIRVQRTKERRERLEQEREERMRDSEQKLKKKFQQHEKILKQKRETFKIKSRIREQRYNKRSGESTSSKDSKEDRTKDNDDFCRNAVNSGQKLYKESNGNRDVTPGENDPVSLDGDVGSNPGVSPKERAILKGCEQTPVEFPVDANNARTVDTTSLETDKKIKFQKYSEQTTGHTRPTVLKPLNTHFNKKNVLNMSEENKYPKLVETKENFEHPGDVKCATSYAKKSKKINKTPKELSKSCNSKNSQNTYLLRSTVKLNKENKINDTTDFSVNNGDNSKSENLEDEQMNAEKHKNIRKSLQKEKKCTNFCFKINKNKPKKIIKAPKIHQLYKSNACKSFIKPMKLKKYRLYDPKESERAVKEPEKTQKIISYKIPEEVKKPDKAQKILSYEIPEEVKKPNETQKILSCEIPEEVGDSSEDTVDDSAEIPSWATGVYLKQALIQQWYRPPNVEDIFGVLQKDSVNLVALFGEDKPSYHVRTSSGNWSLNGTPK